MSGAVSPVSGKPYGLAAVCRAWVISRASVYRRQLPPRTEPRRRAGPVGSLTDAALLVEIRRVLAASPFHGEGHRKIWARLRVQGVRTSKRRVLRLTREHGLLAQSRAGAPRGPRSHDGTVIPATVDTMWGTDLTTVFTGEGPAAVFIAIDHCSAECVGIHASARAPASRRWSQSVRGACTASTANKPADIIGSFPAFCGLPNFCLAFPWQCLLGICAIQRPYPASYPTNSTAARFIASFTSI
jgi:hypothetical protein